MANIVMCTCDEIVADGVAAPEDTPNAEIAAEYYREVTNVLAASGFYWDVESGSHHWRGGRYGNPQQQIGYIYVRGEITPELRAVLERADEAGTAAMEATGQRLLAEEADAEE
ncbi:MAG: hypothetical protein WC992_05925 [Acholeplasmataceae bacterium]